MTFQQSGKSVLSRSSWLSSGKSSTTNNLFPLGSRLNRMHELVKNGGPYSYILRTRRNELTFWGDALTLLHKVSRTASPFIRPSPREQCEMLDVMASQWSLALMYFVVLKKAAKVDQVNPNVVAHLLHLLRTSGSYHLAKHVVETDLPYYQDESFAMPTNVAKAVFELEASAGNWLDAVKLVAMRHQLMRSPGAIGILMKAIARQAGVDQAMTSLRCFREFRRLQIESFDKRIDGSGASTQPLASAPPDLYDIDAVVADEADGVVGTLASREPSRHRDSSEVDGTFRDERTATLWLDNRFVSYPNVAVLSSFRALPGVTAFHQALELVADNLSTGNALSLHEFSTIGEMLNRRGEWQLALDIMVNRFDVLETGFGNLPITIPRTVMNSLACYDPYTDVSTADLLAAMLSSAHESERVVQSYSNRKLSLVFPQAIFGVFRKYLMPLSVELATRLRVQCIPTPAHELMDKAIADNDVTVVIDTNVLMWCAQKNLTLESFFPPMREVHQHLNSTLCDGLSPEGKNKNVAPPLQNIVLPFTALLETYRLVFERPRRNKVKKMLWNRIQLLLRRSNVKVLSYSSEFPTVAFQLISRGVMRDIDGRSVSQAPESSTGRKNPDENIMNVCLSLQCRARWEMASRSTNQAVTPGSASGAFLKYHVRRLVGQATGPASDRVILFTFDKGLSFQADLLGIDTFPLYSGPLSRCKRSRNSAVNDNLSPPAPRPSSAVNSCLIPAEGELYNEDE